MGVEPPATKRRKGPASKKASVGKSKDLELNPGKAPTHDLPAQVVEQVGRVVASVVAAEPRTKNIQCVTEFRACFMATGLTISQRRKNLLLSLRCTMVEDWQPCVTHLVADTFRRTTKMMCAISAGAAVVTPEYVRASCKAGLLLDSTPFLLSDKICEAAFARKRGLRSYSLAEAIEIPMIVSAAGGTWLREFPADPDGESVLLLSERYGKCPKEAALRSKHRVYDVEMLREAACTQVVRKSAYHLRREHIRPAPRRSMLEAK